MPIDFVVQDASGAAQGEALTSPIDFVGLELAFSEFPMLAGLQPWGKTVFNRKQVHRLMEEVLRLQTNGSDPLSLGGDLHTLAEMCARVASAWHLYLVALGD